ncbi:MAG: TonB-dependent siderophore receptor [Pseudomonadota bacterium]
MQRVEINKIETNNNGAHESGAAGLLASSFVQATVRSPGPAMLSLASVMLAATSAPAMAQDARQGAALPTIDVQETAGSGEGYQATQSTIARSPVPLLNTAQSVTVIPQQILREQNTTSLQEALRNVAGITFRAGEGGNGGDNPYIRGFDARNDIFRDGVRDPGWYTRDTFSTERIEVLKGPSSFLFGRGSTGGVINTVTKTPKKQNYVEGEVSGAAPAGFRATLDANGQLNENVAARIAVMGQDLSKAGREVVDSRRWGVAPSIAVDVTDKTKLTASYIYQHTNQIPDFGVPFIAAAPGTTTRFPAPVPRSNFYGVLTPSLPDVETNDAHIATLKIEHEINDQFRITNTSRYADITRFLRVNQPPGGITAYPGQNLNIPVNRNRWQLNVHNKLAANQTDVVGKFETWGLQHTLATGMEFTQEDRTQVRQTITGLAPFNLLYPDPYPTNPGTVNAPILPGASASGRSAAVYVADQIKINRWFEVMGGARFENYRSSANAQATGAIPAPPTYSRTDDMFSWRVGGIFHPTDNTSLYVMHGNSFNPSAEFITLTAANANLAPEENKTTELGAKADVLGGRLSLAAAVFRTEKTNMRVQDPVTSTVNILAGVARVEGFEVSAQGRLSDKWEIIASYTHLDSRMVSTTVASQLGKELIQTPNNAFSLWTTYAITPDVTLGGGAYYVDAMWGNVDNTTRVPDYWRFDAMASYKLAKNATLQLNVYNIADKYYYESAYSNWAVPAAGRTAMLALRAKF